MKNGWLKFTFILILLAGVVTTAFAQDLPYLFEVNKETVHVYWNEDGTLDLDYTWTFTNLPGSHPIDFVDVGAVNSTFDLNNVRADVDGTPVSVSWDDYMGNGSGFAIVMGGRTIPAGASGTVHVFIPGIENVLYPDWDDETYTSASFAPTWFGSEFVSGTTDFTMTFHLPPNMNPEEPRWHNSPEGFPAEPQTGFDANGRITYTWYSPNGDASRFYDFGASFPRTYVPAESIYTPPPEPLISDDMMTLLFVGGCFASLFVVFPFLAAQATRAAKRRKLQYLPPKISIEGHGIKRGLTAVEAAILMEQPLDKILTMILFGIIKKGAASVKTRSPLELDIASPAPEGLHQYETDFLKAFRQSLANLRQGELRDTVIKLVRGVSDKMRGFSRRETVAYYKAIMEKAWKQIEAAGTPEVKSRKFDEALEWTMLDKDYDDHTRRVFQGPIIAPTWWGRYDPTHRPASSFPTAGPAPSGLGRPASGSGSSGGASLPGADFAAAIVTGVQGFAGGVVGNINEFTGGIANITNPPPPPPKNSGSGRSGGGSSGGRSCACACACAGCACACAGGGR
jgi:hypothetical protein